VSVSDLSFTLELSTAIVSARPRPTSTGFETFAWSMWVKPLIAATSEWMRFAAISTSFASRRVRQPAPIERSANGSAS
jgi:hypothetical protein